MFLCKTCGILFHDLNRHRQYYFDHESHNLEIIEYIMIEDERLEKFREEDGSILLNNKNAKELLELKETLRNLGGVRI